MSHTCATLLYHEYRSDCIISVASMKVTTLCQGVEGLLEDNKALKDEIKTLKDVNKQIKNESNTRKDEVKTLRDAVSLFFALHI